ncbi:hypothetical protein [Sneathiella glossodoripedis]|uniref:hypothetical protein n=1 Tax=Sneathiella glossodoripedis TaxID=418853 RepID=UPI0011DD0F6C|nr:hypothetical protein [Sneathiella glossodoripedis]
MSESNSFSMPDMETKEKLDKAAQIITEHLDKALEKCVEEGLERDYFNAGVVATLMQAMETSLGGSAAVAGALHQMAEIASLQAEREAEQSN